jgi:hypothetical protein
VVHFMHLANLVMRWLLQITIAQSTHKYITCSMFRTFFRLAFRFAAALSLATFCDTAASSAADKGECALKDCEASNVTGSGDDSGDWLRLCVCVCARVTFHEVMRRARKRELQSKHARHTDSLRPSIRISVRIAFLFTTCPVVEVHGRSLCHCLTPLAATHRTC